MREMGTVDLLTREGEIGIAKRIEEGTREVQYIMAYWPGTVKFVLDEYQQVLLGEKDFRHCLWVLNGDDGDFILNEEEIELDLGSPKTTDKDDAEEDGESDGTELDDTDDSSLDP